MLFSFFNGKTNQYKADRDESNRHKTTLGKKIMVKHIVVAFKTLKILGNKHSNAYVCLVCLGLME